MWLVHTRIHTHFIRNEMVIFMSQKQVLPWDTVNNSNLNMETSDELESKLSGTLWYINIIINGQLPLKL